jgi:hypothetical protein
LRQAIQPATPASTPVTSSIGVYIEQGLDGVPELAPVRGRSVTASRLPCGEPFRGPFVE